MNTTTQHKAANTQVLIEEAHQHSDNTLDLNLGEPTKICGDALLNGILGVTACSPESENDRERLILIALIRQLGPQIIKNNNGAKLLAAYTVLVGLQEAGQAQNIKNADRIGECLGNRKGGLRLPKIKKSAKARYALHLIDATDAEKAAFQAALDDLTVKQRQFLIFA